MKRGIVFWDWCDSRLEMLFGYLLLLFGTFATSGPSLQGMEEVKLSLDGGVTFFREETDALLQIVERVGTIKNGLALFRTVNELSTALTSNLIFTSVVGYSGTQYVVSALIKAKQDVRISIPAVDILLRLLLLNKDEHRAELATFAKIYPIWLAYDHGLLHTDCFASISDINSAIAPTLSLANQFLNDKSAYFQSHTSNTRIERDAALLLRALIKPLQLLHQFLDQRRISPDSAAAAAPAN